MPYTKNMNTAAQTEPVLTLNPGRYVQCRIDSAATTEPGKISIALRRSSDRWELYSVVDGMETFHRMATLAECTGFEIAYQEAKGATFKGITRRCEYTVGHPFALTVGQAVMANGYSGTVTRILSPGPGGSVEVRVRAGVLQLQASFPAIWPDATNGAS